MPSIRGFAEDQVCPKCQTYTQQEIVKRGIRKCLGCRTVFPIPNKRQREEIKRGKIADERREVH